MADPIFEKPELVAVYDYFDGKRDDLIFYLQLAKELNATHVIDVGCGTGCLSTLLIENGFEVTAVDPAKASLEAASKKPFSTRACPQLSQMVAAARWIAPRKFRAVLS